MKVLHAVHGYPPEFVGGTELYVERLAREQLRSGHEVIVIAGSGSAGQGDFESSDQGGIHVLRITNTTLYHDRWDRSASPRTLCRYRELLERERPDIVHVHQWLRLSRGLVRAAASSGIASVITAHDLFSSCPRVFRVRDEEVFCERPLSVDSCLECVPREPWMSDELVSAQIDDFASDMKGELSAASRIVVPSGAHARLLASFTGVPAERITVLAHGSTVEWRPRPESNGAAWTPGSARRLRVAHWGHLDPVKGAHVLLRAVAMLERTADVQVVLWGPAQNEAYARRLQDLGKGLIVERRERFDPTELSGLHADLAVFPSLAHESHSVVLDEAFALGLPVFVSDRGAPPERCGRAGATFPPGDEAALARLIERALRDPDFLASMRESLPVPTSFAEHWQKLEEVYRQSTDSPSRQPIAAPSDESIESWELLARSFEDRARRLDDLRKAAELDADRLRRNIGDFTKSIELHRARIQEQESDLSNHRSELARITEDNALHRTEIARLRKEVERYEEEDGRLRREVERYEEENVRLRQEAERYGEENARLRSENRLARPLTFPARLLLRLFERGKTTGRA